MQDRARATEQSNRCEKPRHWYVDSPETQGAPPIPRLCTSTNPVYLRLSSYELVCKDPYFVVLHLVGIRAGKPGWKESGNTAGTKMCEHRFPAEATSGWRDPGLMEASVGVDVHSFRDVRQASAKAGNFERKEGTVNFRKEPVCAPIPFVTNKY